MADPALSAFGAALAELVAAPVSPIPEEFAPVAEDAAADLAPPAWRGRAVREARSRRLWRRVAGAAAIYAAAWVAAGAYLGIESERLAAARKEIGALQPRVDAVIAREARYRALAPAVDPARSAVELLFQAWQCLPSADTRLTRLELTPDQITVEGEAPNARQAVAFGEHLKARPELADYRFDSGRPILMSHEHAQYRIFGKR